MFRRNLGRKIPRSRDERKTDKGFPEPHVFCQNSAFGGLVYAWFATKESGFWIAIPSSTRLVGEMAKPGINHETGFYFALQHLGDYVSTMCGYDLICEVIPSRISPVQMEWGKTRAYSPWLRSVAGKSKVESSAHVRRYQVFFSLHNTHKSLR